MLPRSYALVKASQIVTKSPRRKLFRPESLNELTALMLPLSKLHGRKMANAPTNKLPGMIKDSPANKRVQLARTGRPHGERHHLSAYPLLSKPARQYIRIRLFVTLPQEI